MSKYGIAILTLILIGFLIFMINTTEMATLAQLDTFTQPENFIDQAFSIIGTFWRMVTFQVVGMPSLVNVLLNIFIIYPIGAFWALMIANWIRGNE